MNSEKINFKIILVLVLYLSSLLAANTLGLKLMPFIFGTHLSVAVFFFPFVFLSTDVIGQVYGKTWAKNFVYAGLLATAFFTLYAALSLSLPWSTTNEKLPEAYALIFGVSLRMSLASLLAFFIAEYQDVIAFFFFKKLLHGRFFWLQSNLSNIWSQLLDTLIFMFVAFAGIYPFKTIILASLPWWLYKAAMGFAYTPLSYLGVYLLRYGNTRPQD